MKLRPGLMVAGGVVLGFLALLGLTRRKGKDDAKSDSGTASPLDNLNERGSAIDDDAREAGKRAGREALHRSRGGGGD